jgi:hypothetical protein
MEKLPRYILLLLFTLSIAYSAVQAALNARLEVVSDTSDLAWAFVFSLLVAVWATKEPRQAEFSAPFEFGAFLYFAWPVVLPYYLTKTRGLEGIVLFLGFLALYFMPFLSGLVAYVYLADW